MPPDRPAPKEIVLHYYLFNIGDYASHTRHLTVIEDIAYRRLLDAYYLQEHPLNASVSSVARQINMREHEPDVKTILEEFFILGEDGWRNERADKEIDKFHDKSKKASDAGKASAEQRKNKRSTDVEQTFNQPININQEPITINQEQEKKRKKSKTLIPDDFGISDSVKRWADENGHSRLEERLSHFITASNAKAYMYADWDAAFRNAISGDWAKLGKELKSKSLQYPGNGLPFSAWNSASDEEKARMVEKYGK